MHAARESGWSLSSGKQLEKRIERLDPSVREANLLLTPNPKHIERYPQIEEFWGEEIRIRRLPLERFDLDAKTRGASQQTP